MELELLKEFMAVDSATLNKAGVTTMQSNVATFLSARGFKLASFTGEARFGDLLVAEIPGDSYISLITHSDTVLGNERGFRVEGERGTGSGVIDNKGGLVVGLAAVARFMAGKPRLKYGLRFICSPNEEMGSIGFNDLFRQYGRDTRIALGLEPALDDGSIINQRRGNRWYDIEVTGREAHAGRSYGRHANAAHDLAAKIVDLGKLTDYARDIAVNVGSFEGGAGRHNVICGRATAKLDTRFASVKDRDHLHRQVLEILSHPREISLDGEFRTETRVEVVDDCPPFTSSADGPAAEYTAIVAGLEKRAVTAKPAGGAGDVNYLSTGDNFVLDGLGPVGGEMHTTREFVHLPSLETRAVALAAYLSRNGV